jgi:hypothetical protein
MAKAVEHGEVLTSKESRLLQGLTRQSILFERLLRRVMDARAFAASKVLRPRGRVRPAHDASILSSEWQARRLRAKIVIAGLDPAIHLLRMNHLYHYPLKRMMDARVKPAHDTFFA